LSKEDDQAKKKMQPSLLGFFWAFTNFASSGKFSEERCGFGLNKLVGG
jgi:hypothetical protein